MSYKKIIDENKSGCANPHIGAIIKRRRHLLKMTLEEVTKGICCVSYLSKLENGTITPKRYVLNEVLDRLKLKEENLRSKEDYISIILNCIIELYYKNMEYIGNAYKDIIDVESIHFTDVIKAIYFVSTDNVDEAEKAINNAMIMKRQLEKEELYACIIISTLVNIKRQKYNDALEIIKTIEHTYLGDIVLEKFKLYLLAEIYLIIGKYLQLVNVIIMYQDLCSKTADLAGIIYAKKKLCLSLAYSGDDIEAMEQFKTISRSLKKNEEKDFLKEMYVASNKPTSVISMSNANNIDKLWAYNLLKNKNQCLEIIDKIDLLSINDERKRLFVESLMKKYLENEYFYIAYLRNVYYPFLLEHGFYEESKYVHKILFDFLIAESRYKEAVKIDKDFKKIF